MVTVVDKIFLSIDIMLAKGGVKELNKMDGMFNKLRRGMNAFFKNTKEAQGAMFGFGLSVLFGGMAIKNFSQKVLTSLVTSFTTARDEGDFLANKVLGVSAAFEFLKFSIFDAFANTDVFLFVIEAMINMTNAISLFISKHPGIAVFTVALLSMGVVLGSIAMVLGQMALIAIGFGVSMATVLGIFIGFAVVIGLLAAIWTSDLNPGLKAGLTFFVLIAAAAKLLGASIFAVFANPIVLAIAAVVIGLFAMSGAVGGIGNAFLAVGVFILRVLASIADGIYNVVIIALNELIKVINRVIRASNTLFGTDMKEIKFIEGSNLGGKVDQMRDNLLAQGEAAKEAASTSVTNNINVEGSIIGEEEMVERVMKSISDSQLGSPNGG